MAVALVGTMYGAYGPNLIAIPFSEKLVLLSARGGHGEGDGALHGILAIQAGDNPRTLQQKLITYLACRSTRGIAKRGGVMRWNRPPETCRRRVRSGWSSFADMVTIMMAFFVVMYPWRQKG